MSNLAPHCNPLLLCYRSSGGLNSQLLALTIVIIKRTAKQSEELLPAVRNNKMRNLAAISCLLIVIYLSPIQAKVFQKCALAKLLDSHQISRTLISNWICLVNAESGADTTKKVTLDNQTSNYGIFQINSKDWCRAGRKGGKCNKNCEAFLTDDISDDIECAKQIHKDQGFSYWKGWVNKCKQKPLPDISMCWN